MDNDYSQNQGSSNFESNIERPSTPSSVSHKTFKETFREGTPDDVRDKVKDVVQKGVAAVAGALKGFSEQTQKTDMPGTTKSAIHQAGETTRSTVSSVTEEAKNLKPTLQEAGQKLTDTARGLRSTAKEQAQKTREAVKGGGSMSSSSLGSTETSSYDLGGSSVRSSTGQGSEIPDISRTPLAESDKKLQGKDLSSKYEE